MKLRHPLHNERIIIIIRKHWIIFLLNILRSILLLLIPIAVYWFLRSTIPTVFEGEFFRVMLILFGSIYYLLIWLFLFIRFIDLYLDVWIVTNIRIINVNQKGMFSRVEAEHKLEKIQDITTEVHGIGATVFNYGDLHVQTAGESQRFIFTGAPDPYALKKSISDLLENLKKNKEL